MAGYTETERLEVSLLVKRIRMQLEEYVEYRSVPTILL